MKKVFISQPMKGKSNEEIRKEREVIIEEVSKELDGEPFEVMDTVFDDFDGATPQKFLAKSLMVMADADAVYFADGWREAMGCSIENRCAVAYGLNIIKEQGVTMSGIVLTIIVFILLTIASGFFLLAELDDRCKDEEKEEDDGLQ